MTKTGSVKCGDAPEDNTMCSINFVVVGNVTFQPGALIEVSTLRVKATGDVNILPGSAVNTTARGLTRRTKERAGFRDAGGSNGGRGGQAACDKDVDAASAQLGDPVRPWQWWLEPSDADDHAGYGHGGAWETDPFSTVDGGRGGGRIALSSSGRVAVGGSLLADGAPAPLHCRADCGSGAGGTIFLNGTLVLDAYDLRGPLLDGGAVISASGGDTLRSNTGAGGGGRIAILATQSVRLRAVVRAFGGLARVPSPRHSGLGGSVLAANNCQGGAAGTIVRGQFSRNASAYLASMQVSANPDATDFAGATTPLRIPAGDPKPDQAAILLLSVRLSKYVSVNASQLELESDERILSLAVQDEGHMEPGVFVDAARLLSVFSLNTSGLQLLSGSLLSAQNGALVRVHSRQLLVDASSTVSFVGNFGLDVNAAADIAGVVRAHDGISEVSAASASAARAGAGPTSLHIFARSLRFAQGATVTSERVTVVSDGQVELASKVSATYIPACAAVERRRTCREVGSRLDLLRTPPWLRSRGGGDQPLDPLANYSLAVVVAPRRAWAGAGAPTNVTVKDDLVVDAQATVSARSMLLCSTFMRVSGKLKASGQGCMADAGPGHGCSSTTGAGGGGGHGGLGGEGIGCWTRGATYDSVNVPIISGSGGGSGMSGIGGGNGGGVVYVGATEVLELDGTIAADGSDGAGQETKRGSAGGGGSGGSVQVSAPKICTTKPGSALVSASGGNGGEGGGGGGGGGRIAINFTDEFSGGIRAAAQGAPRGSRFVLPSGTSCTHFGNFSSRISASGGEQGRETQAQGERGDGRVRRGTAGSIASPVCSEGHGGSWCMLCDFGFYKGSPGPGPCQPCDRRDCITKGTCVWMAEGATDPYCPVICNPGYVLPNCVSPVENLIQAMGGIVVFAVVIAALGLLLVVVFTCVCTRVEWCPGYYANEAKLLRKRMRTATALRDHRRQPGFAVDADGAVAELESSGLAPLLQGDAGSLLDEAGAGMGASSEAGLTASPGTPSLNGGEYSEFIPSGQRGRGAAAAKRAKRAAQRRASSAGVQNGRLCEGDVPFHLTRIYLAGTNRTGDPWRMPENLPRALEGTGLLDAVGYTAMARRVNELARFSAATRALSVLLHVVCYPLGYLYMKRQRRVRAYVIREFFATYDHACVNNTRARALMNTFKFGRDKDATLCYVDVLGSKPTSPLGREARLPLLLFLSGDGSYWNPYYIDWSDMLVRAVPHLVELRSFIDQAWADLVTNLLTAALRPLDPDAVAETALPAMRVLDRFGTSDRLGGLALRLGIFATPGFEDSALADGATWASQASARARLPLRLSPGMRFGLVLARDLSSVSATASAMTPPEPSDYVGPSSMVTRVASISLTTGSGASNAEAATALPPASPVAHAGVIGEMLSRDEIRAGAAALEAFELEERRRQAHAEGGLGPSLGAAEEASVVLNADHATEGEPLVAAPSWTVDGAKSVDLDGLASAEEAGGCAAATIRNEALLASEARRGAGASFRPGTEQAGWAWDSAERHSEADGSTTSGLPRSNGFEDGAQVSASPFVGRLLSRRAIDDYFDSLGDYDDNEEDNVRQRGVDAETAGGGGELGGARDSDSGAETGACGACVAGEVSRASSSIRRNLGVLLNRAPRKRGSQLFSRVYISVLLAIDVACTFFLLTTFFCVNRDGQACSRTLFVLANAVYPFALIVGPLLGLTFVVFPLSGMGRQYAVWNSLAAINAAVACVLSAAYWDRFSFNAGLFSALLLVVKFLQSRAVDWYIAMVETDRGRRRQRN